MMNTSFNLRKARKLELKIQSFINVLDCNCKPVADIRAKASVSDAKTAIATARQEYLIVHKHKLELMRIKFLVRDMIGKANDKSGLNELLTRKALAESQIRILNEAMNERNVAKDLPLLQDEMNAQSKALDEGSMRARLTISAPVLEESDRASFEGAKKTLLNQIEEIEDKVAKINVESTIVLPIEDFQLLKKLEII